MDVLLYTLRVIAALIVIIWLVNISLKWLNNLSNNRTQYMQIIERFSINKTTSLMIVRILNDYYLISVSEKSTDVLQKFTKEEASEIESQIENRSEGKEQYRPKAIFQSFDWKEMKNRKE